MTNNILEVLNFMFDFLFDYSEKESLQEIDDDVLKAQLAAAGFDEKRIDKALNWLENMSGINKGNFETLAPKSDALRLYSQAEKNKLDVKAINFLMLMEDIEQITPTQREMIIEQSMSLQESKLSLEDFKWVVMMVIGNIEENSLPLKWFEFIVFEDDNKTLH